MVVALEGWMNHGLKDDRRKQHDPCVDDDI